MFFSGKPQGCRCLLFMIRLAYEFSTQGGPLRVISRVIANPFKWPYIWVTGVITLLTGVITPVLTGRGPPCRVSRSLLQEFDG